MSADKNGKPFAIDGDSAPELDDSFFANARPASEMLPDVVERARRVRGKQIEQTKERITIRIDADLADHFRATGKGWQTRLNNVLRDAVFHDEK